MKKKCPLKRDPYSECTMDKCEWWVGMCAVVRVAMEMNDAIIYYDEVSLEEPDQRTNG